MAESITIDFSFDYDTEEPNPTAYKQSIEELRKKLAVSSSNTLPVLPPQENPPTHWFDVILLTKDCGITLRIRRGNLNLDGYRMGTNSGNWLEFGSDTTNPTHLIPDSFFLGFTGDYNSLEGEAGVARNSINLGQKQLIGAVNTLAKSTESKERAKFLIIVTRMICESIRYARISDHIATYFTQESGFVPDDWMNILESNWERLSLALLTNDFEPLRINPTEIERTEQVVKILGIIHQQPR